MTNRERAIEIADAAIEQIESGNIVPDTPDLMAYALILVLADVSQRLEDIEDVISAWGGPDGP